MESIPDKYRHGQLILASKEWVCELIQKKEIPEAFPTHPDLSDDDVAAFLRERRAPGPDWAILEAEAHPRMQATVRPIPSPSGWDCWPDPEDMGYEEALRYVSLTNFAGSWKLAHESLASPHSESRSGSETSPGLDHDEALLEILFRLYGEDCPIVNASDLGAVPAKSASVESERRHLAAAVAIVVESKKVTVLKHYRKFSVHDALHFSPAFLSVDSTPALPLFIAYQILRGFKSVHDLGIGVGDVSLHHVTVDDQFYVALRPDATCNLVKSEPSHGSQRRDDLGSFPSGMRYLGDEGNKLMGFLKDETSRRQAGTEEACLQLLKNFLGEITKRWTKGRLSNFDYILFLNYLAGRTFDNPNHYPVIPWVRDFSSEAGGWRDLTKSKFRLNKGDTQLDLTFNSLANMADPQVKESLAPAQTLQVLHHVSDVLSEITLYVYLSRRTPRSVLCRHVRNRWVPAEYPSSMQRLHEWTPDECIPEFFAEPGIFSSLHEDLPDLEIPSWCSDPEDFVRWHRAALESPRVSERIHHWIDLTFGCKLTGGSAVKAKNVCLHLVDGHTDLRLDGVVQLFGSPHPSKEKEDPFWNPTPPSLEPFLLGQPGRCVDDEEHEDEAEGASATEEIPGDVEGLRSNRSSRISLVGEAGEIGSGSSRVEAKVFSLPKNFDPLAKLQALESVESFFAKNSRPQPLLPGTKDHDKKGEEGSPDLLAKTERIVIDMQVLGCLLLELFLPKKFKCLGEGAGLESRVAVATSLLRHDPRSVPPCVREAAKALLVPLEPAAATDYPPVSESGLPPPSAFQLLAPQTSPIVFPPHFAALSKVLRLLREVDDAAEFRHQDRRGEEMDRKVGEFKVKLVASELQGVFDQLGDEELGLVLPTVKALFADPSTAILSAWLLFDPLARRMGKRAAAKHLLHPMILCYDGNAQTSKHLKLYHRTFLQILLVRFGTSTFLKYFSTYLIEAVGGYKDYEDDASKRTRQGLERSWLTSESQSGPESGLSDDLTPEENCSEEEVDISSGREGSVVEEGFAEGEVFAFDNVSLEESNESGGPTTGLATAEAKEHASKGVIYIPPVTYDPGEDLAASQKKHASGNISQVASESVLWLAHRIGPLLTARHLARNLLRMMNLCYCGADALAPSLDPFPDQRIRVSTRRLHGDSTADKVLECLSGIACLYGDQVILLQYLPYAWELLGLCKKRVSANLEGGILGCISLTHHIVTYLSDSLLMNELPDNILVNILFPALQLVASRSLSFHGGWRARQALAFKLLDLAYLIGLRIGEEMARSHLTQFCSAFFSGFDKVYGPDGKLLKIDESPEQKVISLEMSKTMTPELAYCAYVAFYNLVGRAHLEASIMNLEAVRSLCLQQQESGDKLPRPITFSCLRTFPVQDSGSSSSPISGSGGGNKLDVAGGGGSLTVAAVAARSDDLHGLIAKEMRSTTRHLKGNWLAYWEHETGRADKDDIFNLKQIRLQGFAGHSAGIKCICTLNSENSFLSGSRDKTVKVWSLRSQGDGAAAVSSQWTYSMHKRSVFSATFLEGVRHVASCDSTIHVWDPFVGAAVHQVASLGPVHVAVPLMEPSSLLMAATQDSLLHLVDCRVGSVVTDLKVSMGSAGLVRSLAAGRGSATMIVGHSSGSLSVLDLRTGKLRHSWKGHEGEVLTLTPLNGGDFVSTSLDQTVCVWRSDEGKLNFSLPGAQEPTHCVEYLEESGDLVTATTANRVTVRHGLAAESKSHSHKLRSDVVKNNLTAMSVLSMNKLLLTGQDNGSITLIC